MASFERGRRDETDDAIPEVLPQAVLELFVVEAFLEKGVDEAFGAEPEAADGSGGRLEGAESTCEVWTGLSMSFMPWRVAAFAVCPGRRLQGVRKLSSRCWRIGDARVGLA